jgi:hypothetical protein
MAKVIKSMEIADLSDGIATTKTVQLSHLLLGSLILVCCALASPSAVFAQNTTYSPYTKEQLKEFNSQPISPSISVDEVDGQTNSPRSAVNAKYFRQPEGEEEAEALETESADPYTPISPTFSF